MILTDLIIVTATTYNNFILINKVENGVEHRKYSDVMLFKVQLLNSVSSFCLSDYNKISQFVVVLKKYCPSIPKIQSRSCK